MQRLLGALVAVGLGVAACSSDSMPEGPNAGGAGGMVGAGGSAGSFTVYECRNESVLPCPIHLENSSGRLDLLRRCGRTTFTEAATCSPHGLSAVENQLPWYDQDDCGCEGRSCPAGTTCVLTIRDLGPACGQRFAVNQCVRACTSDGDCSGDEVCLPAGSGEFDYPRCHEALCRSDDDCKAGRCGSCLIASQKGSQCVGPIAGEVRCAYDP